jgi:hypothetical protein
MAMLEIQLNNEEQLTAEAGAMVYIKGISKSKLQHVLAADSLRNLRLLHWVVNPFLLIAKLPIKITALLA